MTHAVRFPPSWPLEMRADAAAAYCDEPSVEAFQAKVDSGIYPKPLRQTGCAAKWYRVALDDAIARRHNTRNDGAQIVDTASLI
tara:strand:- start:1313 stop:1564 length:252 start_codon:yes stop_codon:yes gene_type:complete